MTEKLTTRQAAELLGLSITTITMYCKCGRIRCYKNGGHFYNLDKADIEKFKAQRRKLGRPVLPLELPENFDFSAFNARTTQILEMRLAGLSLQKIADQFCISRQRVQQIITKVCK